MTPKIESSRSPLPKEKPSTNERQFTLSDPTTVYSALKGLGIENVALAERIESFLIGDDFKIKKGDIFVLDTKTGILRIIRNEFFVKHQKPETRFELEDFTFDLPAIIASLKEKTRNIAQSQIDMLSKEYLFTQALKNGNREEVLSILKEAPNSLKYPYLINAIVRLSDENEGRKQLRKVFLISKDAKNIQLDFGKDPILSKYITAVDLFGDLPLVVKNGEIFYFSSGDENRQIGFYNDEKKLSINEGDILEFPESAEIQKELEKQARAKLAKKEEDTPSKKEEVKGIKPTTSQKPAEIESGKLTKEKLSETKFLEKYGRFVGEISKAFGIPVNLLLSVIERESQFNDTIDTIDANKLSVGLMQITGPAVKDLKFSETLGKGKKKIQTGGRGGLFIDFFSRISDTPMAEILSPKVSKLFLEVKGMMSDNKMDANEKKQFNERIIQNLSQLQKTDPFANLLVGSIFLAGLGKQSGEIPPKTAFEMVQADMRKIRDIQPDRLEELVNSGASANTPGSISKKKVGEVFAQIRNELEEPKNTSLHQEYDVLKRYSGDKRLERNKSSGKADIEHKIYYAVTVLINERIRNGRGKEKAS